MFYKKKIMLIVAHPDDEILGPGGTMHRLIRMMQVQTHVVILGEGITSRSERREIEKHHEELEIHRKNILTAQKIIGYHKVSKFDFPDNRFDTFALLEIIKVVEKEKQRFNPDIVFTHHGGDLNIDHRKTFEAVITACRPVENERINLIVTFETMSGTEWQASSDPYQFIPNMFVEINEDDLAAKCKAMESYEFERRTYPHPRSPEALRVRAQMWGVANGIILAEAFQIIRLIEKL